MNSSYKSNKVLTDLLNYYYTDENFQSPPPADPFTKMKIAVVCSKRLQMALMPDAEIFPLTPLNYKLILRYGGVDLLFLESCIESGTGHWRYAQMALGEQNDLLCDAILIAKKQNIPSAFWWTNNSLYSPHLRQLAVQCDMIYSTDFKKKTINYRSIKYLGEAFQPRTYHPFLKLSDKRRKLKNVVLDGIADLYESPDNTETLKGLKDYKLEVIDSENIHLTRSVHRDKLFSDCILGFTSNTVRRSLIKRAGACISFSSHRKSDSLKRLKDMEVMAMGVPLIYQGFLGENDIRFRICSQCNQPIDVLKEMVRLEDPLYRLRRTHSAFRELHGNHTIAHRLDQIGKNLSIESHWDEYPMATLCAATYRKENLLDCIDTFNRQDYPNKELIIVYNGSEIIDAELATLEQKFSGVRVFVTPREASLGGALNCGVANALGQFFFKIDDDDYYGEHYISDLIIAIRAFDFPIFGKPQNNFFMFEGDPMLYQRKKNRGENFFCKMNDKNIKGRQIIIGNTISAKTEFLNQHPFIESAPKHTDTLFFNNLAEKDITVGVCDPFNMVVKRRADTSSHTWTISSDEIKQKCESNMSIKDAVI